MHSPDRFNHVSLEAVIIHKEVHWLIYVFESNSGTYGEPVVHIKNCTLSLALKKKKKSLALEDVGLM